MKIILISILLVISVLAYSQEIQGLWKTEIQIFENWDGGIDVALDCLPEKAILIIQFDKEFGNVTFRNGRESRFLWEVSKWGIYLNYLTEKLGVLFASAQSTRINYTFIDEDKLVLRFDILSHEVPTSYFIFILKRIPTE
ncbi:hypothetical protein ES705_44065 [subsurface metagenome]